MRRVQRAGVILVRNRSTEQGHEAKVRRAKGDAGRHAAGPLATSRNGSHSTARWSKLNSNFGAVWRSHCAQPGRGKGSLRRRYRIDQGESRTLRLSFIPGASPNRRRCSFQSQGNSFMTPRRVCRAANRAMLANEPRLRGAVRFHPQDGYGVRRRTQTGI
jgi:hypothetical protein